MQGSAGARLPLKTLRPPLRANQPRRYAAPSDSLARSQTRSTPPSGRDSSTRRTQSAHHNLAKTRAMGLGRASRHDGGGSPIVE